MVHDRRTGRYVAKPGSGGDGDLPYNPLSPDDYVNPARSDGVWVQRRLAEDVPASWLSDDHLKAVDSDPVHGGERILDVRSDEGRRRYVAIRMAVESRLRRALLRYMNPVDAEDAAAEMFERREAQARRRAAVDPHVAFTPEFFAAYVGARRGAPLYLERQLHEMTRMNVAWLRVGRTYQMRRQEWLAEHPECRSVPDDVADRLWDENACASYEAAVSRALERNPGLYEGGRMPRPRMVVPLSDGSSANTLASTRKVFVASSLDGRMGFVDPRRVPSGARAVNGRKLYEAQVAMMLDRPVSLEDVAYKV